MQSIFKGGFQNWQKKLSKDKNKKPWTCVSREIITPCWFWAEEKWIETFSDDLFKGGSCLHSLVFQLSWTWRRQPVGLKEEKRDISSQITWQGWTHCLLWMRLICSAPCCLLTPPKQSLQFPSTNFSDVRACFCLPAFFCSHIQERCTESSCCSARSMKLGSGSGYKWM